MTTLRPARPDWAFDLRAGRPVVIIGPDRGDLVISAATVTASAMAFLVRHTSGFVCVAVSDQRARELQLPLLSASLEGASERFAVSVDAAHGVTTGISANDRAYTARLLADPATTPDQLTRPGHLVPLRVSDRFVREPVGPAEWALQALQASDGNAAVVAASLVSARCPTELAGPEELRDFATRHGLALGTVPAAGTAARRAVA